MTDEEILSEYEILSLKLNPSNGGFPVDNSLIVARNMLPPHSQGSLGAKWAAQYILTHWDKKNKEQAIRDSLNALPGLRERVAQIAAAQRAAAGKKAAEKRAAAQREATFNKVGMTTISVAQRHAEKRAAEQYKFGTTAAQKEADQKETAAQIEAWAQKEAADDPRAAQRQLEIDNGLIVTELPYFRRAPVNLPASNARRVSELPSFRRAPVMMEPDDLDYKIPASKPSTMLGGKRRTYRKHKRVKRRSYKNKRAIKSRKM